MRRIALAVAILALTVTARAQYNADQANQIDRAYQERLNSAKELHSYGDMRFLAHAAQAPVNRLGITRLAGKQTETKGDVTHLSGLAVVWLNGVRVVADEAFVNFVTSEIEFRGTVKMTAIPR